VVFLLQIKVVRVAAVVVHLETLAVAVAVQMWLVQMPHLILKVAQAVTEYPAQ
jgi:hypothetical protein